MRRKVSPAIADEAVRVSDALRDCRVEASTHLTALAQFVLAIESFEDAGRTPNEIRAFLEEVLAAGVEHDPRADTIGT